MEAPNWSRLVSGSTRPVIGFSTSGCENGLRAWNLSLWWNSNALPWNLVRARLGLHGDDARGGLAELGVVVLRGDLGLADRLQRRVDDDDAQDGVAVLGAVQLVAGAAEVLAVDHGLGGALRVLAGRVVPAEPLGARRQQDELGEVAVEDGQLGELLACSKMTATSARSVLRSWPSAAVTVTASVSSPSSSRRSTFVWVSTLTRTGRRWRP